MLKLKKQSNYFDVNKLLDFYSISSQLQVVWNFTIVWFFICAMVLFGYYTGNIDDLGKMTTADVYLSLVSTFLCSTFLSGLIYLEYVSGLYEKITNYIFKKAYFKRYGKMPSL